MTKTALSDADIRDILASREISHSAMGRRYGCSHEWIRQIRYGVLLQHRCPEIPRWTSGRQTCDQCFWFRDLESPCRLGFPDPAQEGLTFARDCACFSVTKAGDSRSLFNKRIKKTANRSLADLSQAS